jgi:hypothetical protein
MPILIMALVALIVFMVMGLMLFYAAYVETRSAHKRNEHKPEDLHKDLHPEMKPHAPIA